jgi:glucokinase
LAAVASGRGVLWLARTRAHDDLQLFARSALAALCGIEPNGITNELLALAFRDGDGWTQRIVSEAMRPLGRMLAVVQSVIGVDEFVIVGGFADALGASLCGVLSTAAEGTGWRLGTDWTSAVGLGELGSQAGLLGAGVFGTAMLRGGLSALRVPIESV